MKSADHLAAKALANRTLRALYWPSGHFMCVVGTFDEKPLSEEAAIEHYEVAKSQM